MPDNAADRKSVRAKEKSARQSLIIRGEVISGIMSVINGRQWMYERLEESFVFADPFNHDPSIHSYQAGLRAAGIRMFNDILNFCPAQFTLMIEEYHGRSAAASERTNSENRNGGVEGSRDGADRADFDYDLHRDNEGNPAFDGYQN